MSFWNSPKPVSQPKAGTPRAQRFWDALAEWSQATFGTDAERGAIGPLKHLEKEAREAQEALDPIEIADCLLLVFDAARRSGPHARPAHGCRRMETRSQQDAQVEQADYRRAGRTCSGTITERKHHEEFTGVTGGNCAVERPC